MEWTTVVSSFFGTALGLVATVVGLFFSERIRTRLAAFLWLFQEQWKFKADFYQKALGLLDTERRALFTLVAEIRETEARSGGRPAPATPQMRKLYETVGKTREASKRLVASNEIWLSQEVVEVLEV